MGEGVGHGTEPAYAPDDFVLPELPMYATGLISGLGTINVSLLPLDMLATDHAYGESLASCPHEPVPGH